MGTDNKSHRVQFTIGKTSSHLLQEWADNQTLPISKAIREALEEFVRISGTDDITSQEVRKKLSSTTVISPTPVIVDEKNSAENIKEHAVNQERPTEKKKAVKKRNVNIDL